MFTYNYYSYNIIELQFIYYYIVISYQQKH